MGLENLYQKYPWLNKPSYHLMDKLGIVGEDGWLTKKLPDMVESYDNVVDPVVDVGKKIGNIGSEVWEGVEAAGDLIYDIPKWTSKLGVPGPEPEGIGGLKTYWMDTVGPFLGPLTNGKGSGMMEESREIIGSYAAPENLINEFDQLDLGRWDMYQNWKKGSGWDSADDREINKKVKKQMDKMDFGHDAMWPQFLELSKVPGNEKMLESEEAINFYYKKMVNDTKKYTSAGLGNEFEFEKTGNDYGKWASHRYLNKLLNKYGRYPLADGLNHLPGEMSFNLSPWGEDDMSSIFNLANDDYINALKKGESDMTPTEWDYGLFDDDSSVGITGGPRFDYSTKEAEEFYEATQALIPELLIGGSGLLKAPKLINKAIAPLQSTKYGRYAREFAPGLLQWGKRDKFGLPKFTDNKGFKKYLNYGIRAVDFARPKGLQFGAAAGVSEILDRD